MSNMLASTLHERLAEVQSKWCTPEGKRLLEDVIQRLDEDPIAHDADAAARDVDASLARFDEPSSSDSRASNSKRARED